MPSNPPSARMTEPEARLRQWIEERIQGGCRILSKGDGCACPLCDLDRLTRQPTEQAQHEATAREIDERARQLLMAVQQEITGQHVRPLPTRLLAVFRSALSAASDNELEKRCAVLADSAARSLAKRDDCILKLAEQDRALAQQAEEIARLREALERIKEAQQLAAFPGSCSHVIDDVIDSALSKGTRT